MNRPLFPMELGCMWKSISSRTISGRTYNIEALAKQQAVKPIRSADELAGDWPADDSIDDFLAFIAEARK